MSVNDQNRCQGRAGDTFEVYSKAQIMKTILTLIFGIFISTAALANTPAQIEKVNTIEMGVELNISIEKKEANTLKVARLYKDKNYRAKKALTFATKNNKSKLA